MKIFLDTNVPRSKKKQRSVLGISDAKIGGAIAEELGLSCQHTDIVPEIMRGNLTTSDIIFLAFSEFSEFICSMNINSVSDSIMLWHVHLIV